jgi:hypothetical protein
MIVEVIDIECFAVLESKNDSPVSTYRHGPESGKLSGQSMKAETRERNILNLHRGVQDAEDELKSLLVLRPDTGIASLFEKYAQAFIGKTANHEGLL